MKTTLDIQIDHPSDSNTPKQYELNLNAIAMHTKIPIKEESLPTLINAERLSPEKCYTRPAS